MIIKFRIINENQIQAIGNIGIITHLIHYDGTNQEVLKFKRRIIDLTFPILKTSILVVEYKTDAKEFVREGNFFVESVVPGPNEKEKREIFIGSFTNDEVLETMKKRKIKTPLNEYDDKEIDNEGKKRKKKDK